MLMIAIAGTMLGVTLASAYWEGRFETLAADLSPALGASNGDLSTCGTVLDYLDMGAPVRDVLIQVCAGVGHSTLTPAAEKQLHRFLNSASPVELETWNAYLGVTCIGRNERGECNSFELEPIVIDSLSVLSE
jgi:hypothetical protein